MRKSLLNIINLFINIIYGRNIRIQTELGRYSIRTTFGHPLKRYLIRYPAYDRFLPFLAKTTLKTVIDIGANIGDTMVLIKSITSVPVICVEPDEHFMNYVKLNIEKNRVHDVTIYPYPISSLEKKVYIEKNALQSTSHTKEQKPDSKSGGLNTKKFSELIQELSIDIHTVGVIKIDTDGFDWDCLNSIADYFQSEKIRRFPEFIYYEHQTYLNHLGFRDPDRKKREQLYLQSVRRLMTFGYNLFYIFDNFGNLMQQTRDLDELNRIVEEIRELQCQGKAGIYFVDVLMVQKGNEHLAEEALAMRNSYKMIIG